MSLIDAHWGLVSANRGLEPLLEGAAVHLLEPPVNVLRLSLHPDGVAPRIVNLHEWRSHLLERLLREAITTGDAALTALHDELSAYPAGDPGPAVDPAFADVAIPLRLKHGNRELASISTRTTFGTAVDVTVAELSIESFFPSDRQTAEAMQSLLS
jgi:MmyB-like transcription regulator ligand binding domain